MKSFIDMIGFFGENTEETKASETEIPAFLKKNHSRALTMLFFSIFKTSTFVSERQIIIDCICCDLRKTSSFYTRLDFFFANRNRFGVISISKYTLEIPRIKSHSTER